LFEIAQAGGFRVCRMFPRGFHLKFNEWEALGLEWLDVLLRRRMDFLKKQNLGDSSSTQM
jgi:hypothetical protein